MNPTDRDWVQEAKNAEAPEYVLLHALRESLENKKLAAFNDCLVKLAGSDNIVLQSTPLELVPVLLSSSSSIDDYSTDIRQTLELIAQYGSAKEILLVVQESLDSLMQSANSPDDEENDQEILLVNPAHVVWKWINLIDMYALAFPRLVLRKRSAPDTANPIIRHLRKSFDELQHLLRPNTSQLPSVVDSCMRLGYALLGWFDDVQAAATQIAESKVLLQDLLFTSVATCLHDGVVLQNNNNLLGPLSAAGSDFAPPASLTQAIDNMTHIVGEFVVFTLSDQKWKSSGRIQQALQSHQLGASFCLRQTQWRHVALRWLTECIAIGLSGEEHLDGDFATDIVPSVSLVAATDPDSTTRGVAFRLLTQIILKIHPQTAFGLVRQLADDECPFPNMRASAISLLRQLVVRAFNQKPPVAEDPFATKLLLHEYADILFKSPLLEVESFETADPQELSRVIESLGFYYVLIARDIGGLTGVRDPGFIRKTNNEFILPLNKCLSVWQAESENTGMQSALGALSLQLERVEEAVEKLKDP